MLRFLKWTLVLFLSIAGLGFLFRERLFRAAFHFSDLAERSSTRTSTSASDPSGTQDKGSDVETCIDRALDETAEALSFTTGAAANDAAGALRSGRANCVGYAALFQRNCDEQLQRAGLDHEWRVLHLRAQLYCGSFNMHRLFSSPFWKDHDICVVENRRTGERIHLDPSLFDALGIRQVSGPSN